MDKELDIATMTDSSNIPIVKNESVPNSQTALSISVRRYVIDTGIEKVVFKVKPEYSIRALGISTANIFGIDVYRMRLTHQGERINFDETFSDKGIEDGDVIDFMLETGGC